jgi:hypothetical protein
MSINPLEKSGSFDQSAVARVGTAVFNEVHELFNAMKSHDTNSLYAYGVHAAGVLPELVLCTAKGATDAALGAIKGAAAIKDGLTHIGDGHKKEGEPKTDTPKAPGADAARESKQDIAKGPETPEEKAAAHERTKIVQVGTHDGRKTWGQGVPCVMGQWGFGDAGPESGSFERKGLNGDQGYTFNLSQKVEKVDGHDVITSRKTEFNTPNGVAIYLRDADGNMKALHHVTSMESIRQPDGTYKITYHVKGENPADPNAPKAVEMNTTLDGRYVQGGEPKGGKLDKPTEPSIKQPTENPQDKINSLELRLHSLDLSKADQKKTADELAQDLIKEKMKLEDSKILAASKDHKNDDRLEAERRKAELEYLLTSEKDRGKFIEQLKSKPAEIKTADKQADPKDTGKHADPKDTDKQAEPKDTGKHADPKDTGKHTDPKDTGKHTDPKDTGKHTDPQDTNKPGPKAKDQPFDANSVINSDIVVAKNTTADIWVEAFDSLIV